MKRILKSSKTVSLKIKVLIVIGIVIAAITLSICLYFSAIQKNKTIVLTVSKSIPAPDCLHSGGFYTTPFNISLSINNPDLQIYYTIDGTSPSLNSERYTAPILISDRTEMSNDLSNIPTSPRWKPPVGNVFKGTTLRAICVDKNHNKSKEMIRTFFVDNKGSKRYSFPVIAITVNKEDLFSYEKGIYVLGKRYTDKHNYLNKNTPLNIPWWYYPANYLLRGADAEKQAHIEFYEPTGKLGFESNIGLRINGNATRAFAQKSLRICFREKYGEPSIKYQLFPTNKVNTFSAFILRNSGNDWDKTMFRDAFMQSLMKDSHVDIQDYRPSIVFINGEYWGIHNIRERLDENYLANKYEINADSLTILELQGVLVKGQRKSEKMFAELLNYIKTNDLSNENNYNYIQSKIDIESFIDFIISNVYFCNSDWPNNNVRFWRNDAVSVDINNVTGDGKWRSMLYDTDWGFGYTGNNAFQLNLLYDAKRVGSVGIIFTGLLKNKMFVNRFVSSFQNHLNTNFKTDTVLNKINEFENQYSSEMDEHINRWRAIGSFSKWKEYVSELRIFAEKRPVVQANQLNKFFNLASCNKVIIK